MPVPDRYRRYEDAWHRAVETVHHRRLTDTLVKRQMMDVAERYNNAIVFPLHDVEGEPEFPALAAQIISDAVDGFATRANDTRSEEHTSELQSRENLVCRLLLEKKKQ